MRAELAPEQRDALELIGDPAAVVAPVHYPRTLEQTTSEESYQWFVRNEHKDEARPQSLAPIGVTAVQEGALPRLVRWSEEPPGDAPPTGRQPVPPSNPSSSGFATLGDKLKHLKLQGL
ncbi:MAG: hypothetical protein SF066_11915 [Thermoanaerobaculia bacterium]|nr:hypothetical protein [Thermoanaerobaculia bacterium]